jgi:hypothetical protein
VIFAVIVVLACPFFVKPISMPLPNLPANVPYVEIVTDSLPVKQSISAGFFLPTENNVCLRPAMPRLAYEGGVADGGNIRIFMPWEREQIIASFDPLTDVMSANILGPTCITGVKSLREKILPISRDRTFFENVLNGGILVVPKAVEGETVDGILVLKKGGMTLVSPNELTEVFADTENFGSDDDGIKFFVPKTLNEN